MPLVPNPIRVLIVDDHGLMRAGIRSVIARSPDIVVAGEASDGVEACEQHRLLLPDVTLMDLQMPRMSGVEAIREIRIRSPKAIVIVLTTYRGDEHATQALRAGAQAYLLKTALRLELIEALRDVVRDKYVIAKDIASDILRHFSEPILTKRELEVLKHVANGCSNRAVAHFLDVSEETIKAHLRSIFAKIRARDRTHAVAIAFKRGLLEI